MRTEKAGGVGPFWPPGSAPAHFLFLIPNQSLRVIDAERAYERSELAPAYPGKGICYPAILRANSEARYLRPLKN